MRAEFFQHRLKDFGWTPCVMLCMLGLYYRGTSLIRTSPPVGPYSSPVPRDLWWSYGGWVFLTDPIHAIAKDVPPVPLHTRNPVPAFLARAKPQTPNPKPQTPNPKPQTPNPKPQAPNSKPQTQNPKSIFSVFRYFSSIVLR